MNKPPTPSSSWTLIPILGGVGFMSGLVSMFQMLNFESHDSAFMLTFFASLTLALALASVLWFLGFIHSWVTVTAFVVATIAVHVLCLAASGDRTMHGGSDMAGVAIFFVIALTLCTVLLLTELRGYQKLRAPVIGVQCAVLASLVFAFSGSFQGPWALFWNEAPLLIMWQAVVGCSVGMAIASAHVENQPQARPYAVLTVLLAYCVAMGVYRSVLIASDTKRYREVRAEMAARLANAPSRNNLPPLTRQPVDRVLVMERVGDCHANETMTTELPAVEQVGAGPGFAPPPARCIYEARYACPSVEAVHVKVTEYPTADWAAYQIMNDLYARLPDACDAIRPDHLRG